MIRQRTPTHSGKKQDPCGCMSDELNLCPSYPKHHGSNVTFAPDGMPSGRSRSSWALLFVCNVTLLFLVLVALSSDSFLSMEGSLRTPAAPARLLSQVIDVVDGPPSNHVVHGSRDFYTPCPPEFRKKAWLGSVTDSHLPRAFRSQGWTISKEDKEFASGEFHILYKRLNDKGSFSVGKPWQRYSRVPGGRYFCHKDTFLDGFKKMQERFQQEGNTKNSIYFLPETYQLKEESGRQAFEEVISRDKAAGNNRPWVLKKVAEDNGRGIEMIPPDSPALYSAVERSQADQKNDYVVQAYICNELTWFGGEKFDLRFYWLIASVDPLIVLYHDGYARVAGALYDETDFGSTGQHLTNHAYRGEVDEDVLADALWRRVRQHYESDKSRLSKLVVGGDPVRHVKNQLKEAIGATAEAFKDALTLTGPTNKNVTTENLFGFYGADFIIDADLDIHYVEAQVAPGLGDGYDYRIELFRSLFRPMINIVEEIAVKQSNDAKANLLPIETLGDWELAYAGGWRYEYEGYERSQEKRGCALSSTHQKNLRASPSR